MSDVQEFLEGSDYERHDTFKFDEEGKMITGVIATVPRTVETEDLSGETSKKLVVDLDTGSGIYAVWVKKGLMSKAIVDALKKAETKTLERGGKLSIKFTGVGQPSRPGYNPPKLFAAKYEPPAQGADVDAIFGDGAEAPF